MGESSSLSTMQCLAFLVASAMLLSGCLGLGRLGIPAYELGVEADTDYGLILTTYEDGEQTSSIAPVITFDFSSSGNVDNIESFGVLPGDGRDEIVVPASEGSTIEVDFPLHGKYAVTAFGVGKDGGQYNYTMEVRIEQLIDWYENDTGNPGVLVFETAPGNGWPIPSHFLLNSTVENPSIIELDGREVDVKWDIVNDEGVCQTAGENIGNGDSFVWKTVHFGPVSTHEIYLTIEDGQDRINVHHSLAIVYNQAN
tara:strand:+ start:453 stop:1217 length:765 start_codon:yes stop_codon:yes gene_type:complete